MAGAAAIMTMFAASAAASLLIGLSSRRRPARKAATDRESKHLVGSLERLAAEACLADSGSGFAHNGPIAMHWFKREKRPNGARLVAGTSGHGSRRC